MESVSSFVESMRGRVEQWAAAAAQREAQARAAHEAKLAMLPPGTCPHCYGTKQIPQPDALDGRLTTRCVACDPVIEHAPGVPNEFVSARFDNYRVALGNRTALEQAKVFLAGQRDLFLVGGVGSGKTRLACTIANECYLSRRMGVRFIRVPMMLHRLQPGRDADEVVSLEQELWTTSLLVLDDIGAERDQATDYTRRTLLLLYEERGDRGLRTVFTSNKTPNEIMRMQDDARLSSRIAGRADVIRLAMPDQRRAPQVTRVEEGEGRA